MKFIFAPDSMKGTLSSGEEIAILKCVAEDMFPGCSMLGIPMADGGEGTVEAILEAMGGELIRKTVRGPLGDPTEAFYGLLDNGTAVIEMSAASGLPLVPKEKRDPEKTTTYGTGELIRDALDRGAKKLLVCVGGSATNDGGMGCITALGVRFVGPAGRKVNPVGGNLKKVCSIDVSHLDKRLAGVPMTVLCDVRNPLCGENGATYVFGPQKGATESQLRALEVGMQHYAELVEQTTGVAVKDMPGAGAAGGLAAALCAFCGGRLESGIETVLRTVDFDAGAEGADLIITGEGCLDGQSRNGKVISGIGSHARKMGIPVYVLAGGVKATEEEIKALGVRKAFPMAAGEITLEQSMAEAPRIYEMRAKELFADWKKSCGSEAEDTAVKAETLSPEPEGPLNAAKNIIYCFSGSGNSLSAALHIAKKLGSTDIISLRTLPDMLDATAAERVGFIFPCYFGGLPGRTEEYISRIKINPSAYTFGVVTCGAYGGFGLGKISEMFRLDYWETVRYPDSAIWLIPPDLPITGKSMEAVLAAAEAKVNAIGEEVLAKEKTAKSPRLSQPLAHLADRLQKNGVKKKAKLLESTDRCVSCGLCFDICPQGNIEIRNGMPLFGDNCIQCLSCLQYCPQQAIVAGKASAKRKRYHHPEVDAALLKQTRIHVD